MLFSLLFLFLGWKLHSNQIKFTLCSIQSYKRSQINFMRCIDLKISFIYANSWSSDSQLFNPNFVIDWTLNLLFSCDWTILLVIAWVAPLHLFQLKGHLLREATPDHILSVMVSTISLSLFIRSPWLISSEWAL